MERLKGEATALKAERDGLKSSLAEQQEAANKAKADSKGADKVAELEAGELKACLMPAPWACPPICSPLLAR